MSAVLLQFPCRKGYTGRELHYLAVCLGYPSSLFTSGFETAPDFQVAHQRLLSGKRVSGETLLQLLDSEVLDDKLDKLHNKYPTKVNVKLIKKAHALLKHRSLTFKEVADSRVAFELYACEDGSGMEAEALTVLRAMKMLERVMSAVRMEAEVQRCRESSDIPGRFQIYEFLDLVVMCELVEDVAKKLSSTCGLPHREDTELSLPDFSEMLMTSDQKIAKHLDEQFRASLHNPRVDLTPAAIQSRDDTVYRSTRRAMLGRSSEQLHAITPSLECSTSRLKQAKAGNLTFTAEQFSACVLNSRRESSLRREPTKRQRHKDPLLTSDKRESHLGMLQMRRPLQFRFHRLPRTPPALNQMPETTPEALNSDPEDRDLSQVIDALCVPSVLQAREAVKSSFESMPIDHPTPSVITTAPAILRPSSNLSQTSHSHSGFLPAGVISGASRLQTAPMVSRREWERQQGLIDDLEWRTLRKSRQRDA